MVDWKTIVVSGIITITFVIIALAIYDLWVKENVEQYKAEQATAPATTGAGET